MTVAMFVCIYTSQRYGGHKQSDTTETNPSTFFHFHSFGNELVTGTKKT